LCNQNIGTAENRHSVINEGLPELPDDTWDDTMGSPPSQPTIIRFTDIEEGLEPNAREIIPFSPPSVGHIDFRDSNQVRTSTIEMDDMGPIFVNPSNRNSRAAWQRNG